uniref:Uncharacterized protein n=1 Tax=Callorhinchus milii TaxID=7868 RepID=A0A4W3GXH3_CALMI
MSIQYGDEEPLAGSFGAVDSFPKDFGYGAEEADGEGGEAGPDTKPRILLMGLRRSVLFVSSTVNPLLKLSPPSTPMVNVLLTWAVSLYLQLRLTPAETHHYA